MNYNFIGETKSGLVMHQMTEGDIIRYNGDLYIVTEDYFDYQDEEFNAIRLYDGAFSWIEPNEKVNKYKGEVNFDLAEFEG